MAFNHVALATRDLPATHRFYTEAMGFTLVHVRAPPPTLHRAGSGTPSMTPAMAACSPL